MRATNVVAAATVSDAFLPQSCRAQTGRDMFNNLRTGIKLIILCSAFIIAIGVTTYQLVSEKKIAIDFARKELVGNRYLTSVREIYAAILTGREIERSGGEASADALLKALLTAQSDARALSGTEEYADTLAASLRRYYPLSNSNSREAYDLLLETLTNARTLTSRIGDSSNLTLDPDLDTYYLQGLVVTKLPIVLGQLGELHTSVQRIRSVNPHPSRREMRILILEQLLNSAMDGVSADLAAAYRGNRDGRLQHTIQTTVEAMRSNVTSYLGHLSSNGAGSAAQSVSITEGDRRYASAVEGAIGVWTIAQSELERLLHQRIDALNARLLGSLALVGGLAGFSIIIALMTYQRIAQPLSRLENLATTVRETRNYDLRMDHSSQDEIGRLSFAFNSMLSELADARRREISEQSELARIARLTTAAAMTASIAHEINQPLTAIVANANAGLRWLSNPALDLTEVRSCLGRIVKEGHRASDVIGSVRAIFKKSGHASSPLDVNDLIRDVLILVQSELENQRILVEAVLLPRLPQVFADRVLLQQVLLNLILNAAEAMRSVDDRARILLVKSGTRGFDEALITVQDSGTGIDPNDEDRIFDAFFTTKADGMGMGLFICRWIIESHGGRLWASSATPYGSEFRVTLPIGHGDGAS
jgi:signal transduction histidine kinase